MGIAPLEQGEAVAVEACSALGTAAAGVEESVEQSAVTEGTDQLVALVVNEKGYPHHVPVVVRDLVQGLHYLKHLVTGLACAGLFCDLPWVQTG